MITSVAAQLLLVTCMASFSSGTNPGEVKEFVEDTDRRITLLQDEVADLMELMGSFRDAIRAASGGSDSVNNYRMAALVAEGAARLMESKYGAELQWHPNQSVRDHEFMFETRLLDLKEKCQRVSRLFTSQMMLFQEIMTGNEPELDQLSPEAAVWLRMSFACWFLSSSYRVYPAYLRRTLEFKSIKEQLLATEGEPIGEQRTRELIQLANVGDKSFLPLYIAISERKSLSLCSDEHFNELRRLIADYEQHINVAALLDVAMKTRINNCRQEANHMSTLLAAEGESRFRPLVAEISRLKRHRDDETTLGQISMALISDLSSRGFKWRPHDEKGSVLKVKKAIERVLSPVCPQIMRFFAMNDVPASLMELKNLLEPGDLDRDPSEWLDNAKICAAFKGFHLDYTEIAKSLPSSQGACSDCSIGSLMKKVKKSLT